MKRKIISYLMVLVMILGISGCSNEKKNVKIGVSLGVGAAARWKQDKALMETKAKELGADIEVRLNTTDEPKTQKEDCIEMIDSGIDVLLLTPRDIHQVGDIIDYANEKDVRVIAYSRPIMGKDIELYIGYDSTKIGQYMGQYLTEQVDSGDYIILKGDENDFNTKSMDIGSMKYIDKIKDNINILLYDYVKGWDPETAKTMVKEAISKNGNKIDAILAPNDKIAAACATALKELGVTKDVPITGMDAELDALKRINAGTQSMTVYLSLENLAYTAIEEAYNMATDKEIKTNATFDNESSKRINAYLVSGQTITKENMKAQIIDKNIYTQEEIDN